MARTPRQLGASWAATFLLLAAHSHATTFSGTSTITSNFNGTAIGSGSTVWFSAVCKVTGLPATPVTIYMDNSAISFTANSVNYVLPTPNSSLTLSATAPEAVVTFNSGLNSWMITSPTGVAGNFLLGGASFFAPSGLPGGINPVSWSARFYSDVAGLTVKWQWAAAVYTSFGSDYNAIGIKPCDDNNASSYKNSDHAGTPENFKGSVTGGARGGGGSNYTGSLSATASVPLDAPLAADATTWGHIKQLYR